MEAWPNFDETVQDIKARLKHLQEAFKPLKTAKAEYISIDLQEEVTKLYDEHGGIDILMKITNLEYITIKKWHKVYKSDREFYTRAKNHPKRRSQDLISKALRQVEAKLQPRKMKSRIEFKGISNLEDIRSLLPVDVQIGCAEVKRLMISNRNTSGGSGIDPLVKMRVAELILDVGHVRPIALLTGLNERVISGWKHYS
jgi:hypothetical protein